MGLFKKKEVKEEETPKLPELPRLPDFRDNSFHNEDFDLPKTGEHKGLPSFSESKMEDNLNQESIKSAIAPTPLTLPGATPAARTILSPTSASPLEKRDLRTFEIGSLPEKHSEEFIALKPSIYPRPDNVVEPVYIRLDKFKSAVSSFDEIKTKMLEIEDVLRKIREVKNKEDEELREWEKEIENIKTRMESIDKSIFSKV